MDEGSYSVSRQLPRAVLLPSWQRRLSTWARADVSKNEDELCAKERGREEDCVLPRLEDAE